jgi:ribosomal protein L3 glutamine methyltransferase
LPRQGRFAFAACPEFIVESLHQVAEQLLTLRDLVRYGASRFARAGLFYGHGTDNAVDEALALALHCLALDHAQLEDFWDARITLGERRAILDLFERRAVERVPVPYLTGEAWFAGIPFRVDERVLIPRSPIAELIEAHFAPWLSQPPARVLDLCSGGGCIGIACALHDADADVVLADISADAVDVALDNIERHGVGDRVQVVQSDLFAALGDERFDLIVSNPPYVDAQDMSTLPEEYLHEPELALAAGIDGLDLVRFILRDAAAHLSDDGALIVEVGNSWMALEEVYPAVPFTWIEFGRGGHGVFLLTRAQLDEHAGDFAAAAAEVSESQGDAAV